MASLSDFFSTLRGSSFARNVVTMLSGTVIAQAIPMAMSPVLTRLYSKEDYGLYAYFLLVSTTISALASLRYEFAIMLPKADDAAANIVALSLWLAVFVSATLLAVTVLLAAVDSELLARARLGAWSYALAPMVLLQSVYQTLSYWLLRKQAFRQLSLSRVFRAIAMAIGNVAMGAAAIRGGLVASSLIGQAVATGVLAARVVHSHRRDFGALSWSVMKREARVHRQFALFALPADLMSMLSQQMPVAILPAGAGGLFAFVQNVVSAPIGFIAGAVLDAFKERATRDYRERGEFREIFTRLLKTLAALAIAPTVILLVAGPHLFGMVFGPAWREGGDVARILAVMFMCKFVVSPLSYSYYVVGRTREDFILHALVVASTAAAMWIGMHVFQSTRAALWLFSVNYSIVYVVYLIRSYQFSLGERRAT